MLDERCLWCLFFPDCYYSGKELCQEKEEAPEDLKRD